MYIPFLVSHMQQRVYGMMEPQATYIMLNGISSLKQVPSLQIALYSWSSFFHIGVCLLQHLAYFLPVRELVAVIVTPGSGVPGKVLPFAAGVAAALTVPVMMPPC